MCFFRYTLLTMKCVFFFFLLILASVVIKWVIREREQRTRVVVCDVTAAASVSPRKQARGTNGLLVCYGQENRRVSVSLRAASAQTPSVKPAVGSLFSDENLQGALVCSTASEEPL